MTKDEVRTQIETIGIIPAIRVHSAEEALFAAQAVMSGGIGVVELTMTVPGAHEVLLHLRRTCPELLVGAGTVLDLDTAAACQEAGAVFLTSPALDSELVDYAAANDILCIPGALTPTEVVMAMKAGSNPIKIFPCSLVGGAAYIRALKAPLPHASLIASGGVNQQTAGDFIRAGAVALGIGEELIPQQAVRHQNDDWIRELARRFLSKVNDARNPQH